MKKFKSLVCLLMVLLSIFALTVPAFAASKSYYTNTSGQADDNDVWHFVGKFTTKDNKAGKIPFTQNKGTMYYQLFSSLNGGHDVDIYGAYTIKVTNIKTNKVTKYYWKYTKNYTLTLPKNGTYKVEIKPYQELTVGEQEAMKSFWVRAKMWGMDAHSASWEWTDAPTWRVKTNSVKNIVR